MRGGDSRRLPVLPCNTENIGDTALALSPGSVLAGAKLGKVVGPRVLSARGWGWKAPDGKTFAKGQGQASDPEAADRHEEGQDSVVQASHGSAARQKAQGVGDGWGLEYYNGWRFPPQ